MPLLFLSVVASLVVAIAKLSMGKLIVSFNRRDKVARIDSGTTDLSSYLALKSLISCRMEISLESFEIEIYDPAKGKYVDYESASSFRSSSERSVQKILVVEVVDEKEILSVKGRNFDLPHGLRVGNQFITIQEEHQAELGTGLITWDGSVVLAKYMEFNVEQIRTKNILEVGAGTGVAGMAASVLGSNYVLLTDLAYSLSNLRRNVAINCPGRSAILPMNINEDALN